MVLEQSRDSVTLFRKVPPHHSSMHLKSYRTRGTRGSSSHPGDRGRGLPASPGQAASPQGGAPADSDDHRSSMHLRFETVSDPPGNGLHPLRG
jgi:hypothetical protein